jgi:hypothetical protein
MFGNHQARDIASVIFDARGGRPDDHIRGNRRDTGSHETSGFFVFHQTHATGAKGFEIRMVA